MSKPVRFDYEVRPKPSLAMIPAVEGEVVILNYKKQYCRLLECEEFVNRLAELKCDELEDIMAASAAMIDEAKAIVDKYKKK